MESTIPVSTSKPLRSRTCPRMVRQSPVTSSPSSCRPASRSGRARPKSRASISIRVGLKRASPSWRTSRKPARTLVRVRATGTRSRGARTGAIAPPRVQARKPKARWSTLAPPSSRPVRAVRNRSVRRASRSSSGARVRMSSFARASLRVASSAGASVGFGRSRIEAPPVSRAARASGSGATRVTLALPDRKLRSLLRRVRSRRRNFHASRRSRGRGSGRGSGRGGGRSSGKAGAGAKGIVSAGGRISAGAGGASEASGDTPRRRAPRTSSTRSRERSASTIRAPRAIASGKARSGSRAIRITSSRSRRLRRSCASSPAASGKRASTSQSPAETVDPERTTRGLSPARSKAAARTSARSRSLAFPSARIAPAPRMRASNRSKRGGAGRCVRPWSRRAAWIACAVSQTRARPSV